MTESKEPAEQSGAKQRPKVEKLHLTTDTIEGLTQAQADAAKGRGGGTMLLDTRRCASAACAR